MENTTITLQQQSNKIYNDEYMELSDAIKQIKEQTGEEFEKTKIIDCFADEDNRISKEEINRYCEFVKVKREFLQRKDSDDIYQHRVY